MLSEWVGACPGIRSVAQKNAKNGAGMTQFGRALSELNIEILCANSSQAKGRVERANRTLQDRLVKELRLADISDMEAGNVFLDDFKTRYNAKFAKTPAKADNLHRVLNEPPDRLADILCWRPSRQICFSNRLPVNGEALYRRPIDVLIRPQADHAGGERYNARLGQRIRGHLRLS